MHYGRRLVAISKNAPITTVKHLVEHYPSHDFVIDDEEAARIFYNVEDPHTELYEVMKKLVDIIGGSAYNEAPDGVVLALTKLQVGTEAEENASNGKEEFGQPSGGDEGNDEGSVDANGSDDRGGD